MMRALGYRTFSIYITLFLGIIVLFVVILQSTFGVSPSYLIWSLSFNFLISWLWMLISWRTMNGTGLNFYGLFLIAAGLFNGGQAFLEVFDLNLDGFLGNRFDDKVVFSTLVFTNLAFLAMHIGVILGSNKCFRPLPFRADSDSVYLAMRIVGFFLLAISLYPAVNMFITGMDMVILAGYFGLYQVEAATGVAGAPRILAQFLVPSILLFLAGSRKKPMGLLVATVLILSYTASFFAMGHRAWGVLPLIAFIWVWDSTVFRLPRRLLLIIGLTLLIVVFPLIRETRHFYGDQRWSLDYLVDFYWSMENPLLSIVSEMGGSMRTISETISFIPSTRDFDYGLSYLYGALTVIPNVFGDIHPTIERGTPSDWITQMAEPIIWEYGGGLGYSFIAEAYFNFGLIGGILFLGIFGYFIGRFSAWASVQGHPLVVVGVGIYMSFFLFYARGDSTLVFRPLVWFTLLPIAFVVLIRIILGSNKK